VTNCRWQTVPHDWPGHRESSVAKFRNNKQLTMKMKTQQDRTVRLRVLNKKKYSNTNPTQRIDNDRHGDKSPAKSM